MVAGNGITEIENTD